MLFFPQINVKMPTIIGILTFMSWKIFLLSRVKHEKSFITSEPVFFLQSAINLCLHFATLKLQYISTKMKDSSMYSFNSSLHIR